MTPQGLDARDRRFIAVCLLVIVAGAAITAALYRRAFPEASIDFRVPRARARVLAESFLSRQGRSVAGTRFAARFGVDDEPKIYLERELGLERASRFYGKDAKVWHWDMRWFRSGEKAEERVSISPTGDLVSWESVRPEAAPGARLDREAARRLAWAFLTSRGLVASALVPIEAAPLARPNRTDWNFVDERPAFRMGEATVRYRTTVSGGEVTGYEELVHVPEAWQREYQTLRSKNTAAGAAATFGLLLTALAMLGVLVSRIQRKDIRWGAVAAFGITGFVLALLATLNNFPLTLYEYDTKSPLSSHLTQQLVLGFFGALATGAGIACVVAAAEPPFRERFPQHLSLSGIFSRAGFRSKRFFKGVLLGYALVAFFCAYQAIFYVVAARFGAWAPAEVNYSDMLSTAFPWATVLLIGFLPAVSEEGISRMFSISFLERLGAGRFVAIVLPAFIWGFGHSAYPNQPFYIRGIEVGCAGVVMGLVFVRFGILPLLVWHFTVDALYTALVMLRSHDAYYIVSGGIAAGILLVPLIASAVGAARRGGFDSAAGATNADLGSAPDPPPRAIVAAPAPPVRRLAPRVVAACAAAAAVLSAVWLVPSRPPFPVRDDVSPARAAEISRRFLTANRISVDRFRSVTYGGTGFAEDADVRSTDPGETGRLPGFADAAARYVVEKSGVERFRALAAAALPLNFWVTRFYAPLQKEEWKVFVDARRGRVIGFLNPTEEAAAAAAAPTEVRARQRAAGAAGALGYPAADYSVLEVGTRARPKRVDTTVVLESKRLAAGEAAPRLTAIFHGPRLAGFFPSIHVPESFLDRYQRRTAADWLLVGLRIVALGSFVGVGLVLFLRAARRPEFRWRELLRPLLPVALLGAAIVANAYPTIFRAYSTEMPSSTFLFIAAISLSVQWLLLLGAAGIAFVLFSSARPGWRRALRGQGSLGDALLRAGIATAGLAALSRVSTVAAQRVPQLFRADPALPNALERAFPSLAVLGSASSQLVAAACLAAVAALAWRERTFRRPAVRVLLLVGLIVVLLPSSPRSAVEFGFELAAAAAGAAWLAVTAFILLRDHPAAWVFFGTLAFGGSSALRLLGQGAAADRIAGAAGMVLTAAVAILLVGFGRREPASDVAPAVPAPLPEPIA
ncbi:MAG TPA: CPBP family intramembrane glutamic endopeptidase [Thermoanaerobaculia bacterium]|nr:CPBP family intramembrane glutamic endopeptidase [Thermoanaerobaculia bacterium]